MADNTTSEQLGPASYQVLQGLRVQYAVMVFGLLCVSWLIGGVVRSIQNASEARTVSSAAHAMPEVPVVFLVLVSLLPGMVLAVVNFIYADKVGMPSPLLPGLLAFIPLVNWFAFFMIIGYTPAHLKQFEPPEKPINPYLGMTIGLIPIWCMAGLAVVRLPYVGMLFTGPP